MLYRLINPSDPYTFEAENLEVAALAVLALSAMFGAESEDKSSCVPVLFGDAGEWFEEKFGRTMAGSLEVNRQGLGLALKSMLYGEFSDRKVYEMAISRIDDPEKQKSFGTEWQNRRTSMNDIGTYAHQLGEKILSGC